MKVLLVVTKSEIGGAQVFVLNLARSLKKSGINVEVAAGEGGYLFEELSKYNIHYHYLNSLKRDFSIFSSIKFIHVLYNLIKINKYDIVHLNSSNTLLGTISVRLLKKAPKIVFTFHGLSLIDENFKAGSLLRPFAKFYFKFFLKMVDKCVFVSDLNYNVSKKVRISERGEVIYNGLDETEMHYLTKQDARDFFSSNYNINISNNFIIGSIGRLAYQKNYEFLLNNFEIIKATIPDTKVIIIGDGQYYKKLHKQINKLNFRNDFFLVGAIKDSSKYIKAFDVFTLPSRYEGLSISLIEALFANVPILASNVGGNSEIVDSRQLFQLNDINDYLEKLIEIKEDSSQLLEHNYRVRNHFSLNTMTQKYIELYTFLCEKTKRKNHT